MFGLKFVLNIVSHVDWKLKIRKCEILDHERTEVHFSVNKGSKAE